MATSYESILDEAAQAILDRDATHGDYDKNHSLTAYFLTGYLAARPDQSHVRPHDICMFNILQKVSRMRCGRPLREHLVDIAGYAELANKILEGEDDD